ncbi:MAG TPA: hypothetical protein VFU12_12525 [Glycomyces sp.]|nr:hypothetical protein [Glycomyces sp.]
MESNADPLTAWVRQAAVEPGAEPETPRPADRLPLRTRRKLTAAVREGVDGAAEALHPGEPQARAHLKAMLFETDSATWPLVDGTGLTGLVAAVREWTALAAIEPAPVAADPAADTPDDPDAALPEAADPLVVALSVAILEAVRRQAVQGRDEALLELWFDFEEASGVDMSRLPTVPYYADDAEDGAPPAAAALGELHDVYDKRRLTSLAPWALALAGAGLAVSLAQLLNSRGPAWIALAAVLAVAGYIFGRVRTGEEEPRPTDVAMLEVYEHGVVVNTATGKEVTVESVRLWAPGEGPIDHRTRGLKLVWSPRPGAAPVHTDLDSFLSHRSLKKALVAGGFTRAEPPAADR